MSETKIRELIAEVRDLREKDASIDLDRLEEKLGALLPPINGKFSLSLSPTIVNDRASLTL